MKMLEQMDNKAFSKLAQLLAASDIQSTLNEKYTDHILHKEGNINFQISADRFLGSSKPELRRCTVLHLAYKENKLKLFNLLLRHGADFNIKNEKGFTVLHQIIKDIYGREAESFEVEAIFDNPFVISVLDTLVKLGDSRNSHTEKWITHFHIACMANHIEAVELFLKRKVPVNQSVTKDSPIFPGYSALHFAVRFCNLDTVKLLLKYSAASNIKDAAGVTPLHMLIKRNMEIADLLNKNKVTHAKHLTYQRNINEDMIHLLLNKRKRKKDVIDDTDMSLLHIACILESSQIAEDLLGDAKYINRAVNSKSILFSGNTALHFAALCNVQKVKLLLKKGANIQLQNAKGHTAFDLCIERYEIQDIYDVIATQSDWSRVEIGVPGKTLLDLVACLTTGNLSTLPSSQRCISGCISNGSPIWSSYYLLHLAVIFSERACRNDNTVMDKIMQGSTPIKPDVERSITPLHLAFRLKKVKVVDFLLKSRCSAINYVDADKLSHLHVACAAGDTAMVANFLLAGAKVNASVQASFDWFKSGDVSRQVFIPKDATPLHIAVIVGHVETMKLLVDHEADIYARDQFGMTPIHWLIVSDNPILPAADILLKPRLAGRMSRANSNKRFATTSVLKERIIETGLSHLHVACFASNATAVEELLQNNRFSINAILLCTVGEDAKRFPGKRRYAGYAPLHFALEAKNEKMVRLLIRRGANVLMSNAMKYSIPLYEAFTDKWSACSDVFISFFKSNKALQRQIEEYFGLTMLHFYCRVLADEVTENVLINKTTDVNRFISKDSPIWPGFTPLHVLITFFQASSRSADTLLHFLLDHGADVTAVDVKKNTPLHLAYHLDAATSLKVSMLKTLLTSQKNFKVNPRNGGGLSHFHVACALGDVTTMKKFLRRTVDVNRSIDHFYTDSESRGCTPLHLVLFCPLNQNIEMTDRLKAVSLLIQHGADVGAENSLGNTPLHLAAKHHSMNIDLLTAIIKTGADIYAENLLGQTPFEMMLDSKNFTVDGVKLFLDQEYCANAFNPITQKGFVAMIFSTHSYFQQQKPVFELMLKACGNAFDKMGRTVIHNVVSTLTPVISKKFYLKTIESLVKIVDIDHQDNLGRTALHVATQFKNHRAVSALLQAGADINLIDANKKTAFVYAFETSPFLEESQDNSEKIVPIFSAHIQKLNVCVLNVHEMNHSALVEAFKCYKVDINVTQRFYDEIMLMKRVKIASSSITLLNIISGTNTQCASSCISRLERDVIENFLETIDKACFSEAIGILRLQSRKIFRKSITY